MRMMTVIKRMARKSTNCLSKALLMRRIILKKSLSEVLIALLAENRLIPHIQVVFLPFSWKIIAHSIKINQREATVCRLQNCLAASYRKFGHMCKLACRAILVMKQWNLGSHGLTETSPLELACRAELPIFLVWPNFR